MFDTKPYDETKRIASLELEIDGLTEKLSKKWKVSPAYITGAYAFSFLKRKADLKREDVESLPLLSRILSLTSYVCGDLLSKCANGAPIHVCTRNGKIEKYELRCIPTFIVEDLDEYREGDILICFDKIEKRNRFRIVDKNGESVASYCRDIPGREMCDVIKSDVKVREVSLPQIFEKLEDKFTEKNKNFLKIEESASKILGRLDRELQRSLQDLFLQIYEA